MIIYIILEAHAWCSVYIASDNGHQTYIVGGFVCNENNCAGMDKSMMGPTRPLPPTHLLPTPRINIEGH
jgi:hypothetical protein